MPRTRKRKQNKKEENWLEKTKDKANEIRKDIVNAFD